MNKTSSKTREQIQAEIDALDRVEYHVETNQGTYSGRNPQFGNREVYETVGGTRRETGPSEEDAPGRMRAINRNALAADRKRLADLRRQLRS